MIPFQNIEIVYYHGNCNDGLASVAIFNHYYPNKKLIPLDHSNLNNLKHKSKNILFLDFSLPEDKMTNLIKNNKIYIVDHHKTAMYLKNILPTNHYCLDKSACGAMLLWKIINKNIEPPIILKYINDRDLWLNKLPNYKYVFDGLIFMNLNINMMEELIFEKDDINDIIVTGKILNKSKMSSINLLKNKMFIKEFIFKGSPYKVGYINCPLYSSDIGSFLVRNFDIDFAAIFHFDGEKTIFSLRGKGLVDLSEIAKSYGGGGHFDAAGLTLNNSVTQLI